MSGWDRDHDVDNIREDLSWIGKGSISIHSGDKVYTLTKE